MVLRASRVDAEDAAKIREELDDAVAEMQEVNAIARCSAQRIRAVSVRARSERQSSLPPNCVSFHKKNRVGSGSEINLFTNGMRKAVAMTPSMALLKDMVVHEATHVFFICLWSNKWGIELVLEALGTPP